MGVTISPDALRQACALIKRNEGYRSEPYRDVTGVPTIGYGACTLLSGEPVTMSTPPMTAAQAEALLSAKLLKDYAPAVEKACGGASLSDGAWAALLDFAYNLGDGNLERSGIGPMVAAGNLQGAAAKMREYTHAGGKVLPDLVARRAAEAGLLLAGAPIAAVPAGNTSLEPPPAPAEPPPNVFQRLWAWMHQGQ